MLSDFAGMGCEDQMGVFQ